MKKIWRDLYQIKTLISNVLKYKEKARLKLLLKWILVNIKAKLIQILHKLFQKVGEGNTSDMYYNMKKPENMLN